LLNNLKENHLESDLSKKVKNIRVIKKNKWDEPNVNTIGMIQYARIILTIILLSFLQIPNILLQNHYSLIFRLCGMSIDGIDFFNIDGVEIKKQSALTNFSLKNLRINK
jgi:hypothetical protein